MSKRTVPPVEQIEQVTAYETGFQPLVQEQDDTGVASFGNRAPTRESIMVDHHLFKLKAAEMMKNTSFKGSEPNIVMLEHGHIYHSHNDKNGRPNDYCTPVGGHTHRVEILEWGIDEVGEKYVKKVKCGPPVKLMLQKRGDRAPRKTYVPIVYPRYEGEEAIIDDHRHELQYLRAEKISSLQREQQRQLEQAKVKSIMTGSPAMQVAAQNKLQNANAPGIEEK